MPLSSFLFRIGLSLKSFTFVRMLCYAHCSALYSKVASHLFLHVGVDLTGMRLSYSTISCDCCVTLARLTSSNTAINETATSSTAILSAVSGCLSTELEVRLNNTALLDGRLQVHVSLFLDGLCILECLDQFHLKEFHLHHFLLLDRNYSILLFNLARDVLSRLHNFAASNFVSFLLWAILVKFDSIFALLVHSLYILKLLLLALLILLCLQL